MREIKCLHCDTFSSHRIDVTYCGFFLLLGKYSTGSLWPCQTTRARIWKDVRETKAVTINGMVTQTHFDFEQLIASNIIYFWVHWLQRQSQDWLECKITCRRPIRPKVCMSVTACVEVVWISLISLFLDLAREVLWTCALPCLSWGISTAMSLTLLLSKSRHPTGAHPQSWQLSQAWVYHSKLKLSKSTSHAIMTGNRINMTYAKRWISPAQAKTTAHPPSLHWQQQHCGLFDCSAANSCIRPSLQKCIHLQIVMVVNTQTSHQTWLCQRKHHRFVDSGNFSLCSHGQLKPHKRTTKEQHQSNSVSCTGCIWELLGAKGWVLDWTQMYGVEQTSHCALGLSWLIIVITAQLVTQSPMLCIFRLWKVIMDKEIRIKGDWKITLKLRLALLLSILKCVN